MTAKQETKIDINEIVNQALEEHGAHEKELIPILTTINQKIGYIPKQAMAEISEKLRISQSQIHSVASFYRMFFTKPVGRHVVKFCESAPCHVSGGRQVWARLRKELNLDAGQTSADQRWTLITVSCLGVCSVAPVMLVDEDIYGNLTPDQLPQILAKYE
jgi:NADH-quinone oxidoreductase subunit E